jgi:ferredoxin-fold anticodon binding domain-containing protein
LRGYIGHVSVLEKVTNNYIFLADSEEGKITKLPRTIFLRLWFDYDEMWYPKKNTDIQLRWLVSVKK